MRFAIALAALLAAAPLGAQSRDSSATTKRDSTPPAPATCVDRNRDRKCDKPERTGARKVRKVGEAVMPTVKEHVPREKGGTRRTPRAQGAARP